jgi:hypothetical protein
MLVLHTDSLVLSSYGGQVHINSSGLSSYVGVTYRQFMVEFIWWPSTYNSSGLSSYVGVTYRQFMVEFIC